MQLSSPNSPGDPYSPNSPGGPTTADAVRREAQLLAEARHPGVIELVDVEGTADRPVLVTAPVDGPLLAAIVALDAAEVAGLMAALASTLADLHDLGIVHGSVDADHVVVGVDGRPVLFGFERGGHAGEVPPGRVDELRPVDDVASLGHLLRRYALGLDARPLRRLADGATAEDPAARPSARDLAATLADAVPGATLPVRLAAAGAGDGSHDEGDGDDVVGPTRLAHERRGSLGGHRGRLGPGGGRRRPGDGRRLGRRRLPIAVGCAAAVAAVAVLAAVLRPAPAPPPTAEPTVPTPSEAPSTTGNPRPPTTAAAARADCPEATSTLLADVDGDGCLDGVRYAGGVVEAAGRRWSLGQAGDIVAVGDWFCRGARTLALLRPSTGEVFPLDGWAAGPGEEVTARAVATVEGGQALRAADLDRDGCHELVVERGTLPPQVLHLGGPR